MSKDVLHGEAGRDELDGAGGDDVLYGGEGDDRWLTGGGGEDAIYGGDGNDLVDEAMTGSGGIGSIAAKAWTNTLLTGTTM